jgi:hypothetical protein
MSDRKAPFSWILGPTLHDYFDTIASEPLPKRWVDLINHLNELERRRTAQNQQEHCPRDAARRHRT